MATATAPISAPAATLPPLSKEDFKTFNLLAEIMDKHHNHFRSQWNILWETATTGRRPQGMTVKQLVKSGLEFAEYLSVHHDMEEKRMFPMLGNRIKEFDPRNGELHLQHEEIHKGLSQLEAYLKTVKKDENEFDVATLKSKMEGWAEVLWAHLDDEVRALGAENMRQHFTKEEMQKMRW